MVAGSLPRSSGRPIGVVIRAIARRVVPLAGELLAEPAPTWRATRSGRSSRAVRLRSAASHSAASSAWSWVITRTCVPAGSSARTSSGSTGTVVRCTRASASASAAKRLVGELLGAGSRPGAGPGRAGPGSAPAPARRGPSRRSRPRVRTASGSSSTRHLATAALHAMGDRRLVGEIRHEHRGARLEASQQLAGPLHRGRLEVAAADRAPGAVPPDDHLRPGRAGRVPPHARRAVTRTPGSRRDRKCSTAASHCIESP